MDQISLKISKQKVKDYLPWLSAFVTSFLLILFVVNAVEASR